MDHLRSLDDKMRTLYLDRLLQRIFHRYPIDLLHSTLWANKKYIDNLKKIISIKVLLYFYEEKKIRYFPKLPDYFQSHDSGK